MHILILLGRFIRMWKCDKKSVADSINHTESTTIYVHRPSVKRICPIVFR